MPTPVHIVSEFRAWLHRRQSPGGRGMGELSPAGFVEILLISALLILETAYFIRILVNKRLDAQQASDISRLCGLNNYHNSSHAPPL